MANTWFQFRRFRVEQDRCAMKVSTDACVFGAWAPLPAGVRSVLDVGTGTGLLALLLAQRFPDVRCTALELDPAAAGQARTNAAASPFAGRIVVEAADARSWSPPQLFDALICNPPFFHHSLQGPDPARNAARHGDDAFSLPQLLALMERALAPDGTATVLLPAARAPEWERLLRQAGWSVDHALTLRPKAEKAPNRWMGRCVRGPAVTQSEELVLYDADGQYTAAAAELLRPFYLEPSGHKKTGL